MSQLRISTLALLGDVASRAAAGYVASTVGIAAARRMLELEPTAEAAHRSLMRLFADAGQPTASLAQFDTCMHVSIEEFSRSCERLGIAWSEASASLFERLGCVQVNSMPHRSPNAALSSSRASSGPSRHCP